MPIEGYDKFTYRAVCCLIGSWFVHLVAGAQYAWGNMSPYIVSYYKNEKGIPSTSKNQFYAILPLVMVITVLVFPVGMATANNCGSRWAVLIGGIIICLSVFLTSFGVSPTLFFIFYAGGFGLGKGLIYPAPLRASWSHLGGRKGLVSGVLLSGLGFGSFIAGILVNILVNPNNIAPEPMYYDPESDSMVSAPEGYEGADLEMVFPPEVSSRVPRMLWIMVIIWAAKLGIGLLLISDFDKLKKNKEGKKKDGSKDKHWEEVEENVL